MTEPAITEKFIDSKDGTRLRTIAWAAPEEIKARVMFVHGWAEYADRYRFPATWLTSKGYACFGLDCRGHGGSAGKRGFIRSFDEYLDDVEMALDALPGDNDRTFLVGHSQGGLVCARLLEQRGDLGLAGLVLSSPFLRLARELSAVEKFMSRKLSKLFPGLRIPSGLDVSDISKDEEVVRAYAVDPLIFRKPVVRWAAAVLDAQQAVLEDAGKIEIANLTMHGADDKIAHPETTRAFFEGVASEDKTLKLYEGLRHEIFNEIERDTVFADVEAWLDARCLG